ncbi:hypothetical protein [Sphingobium chlorophenolicum]|nr:hypothetical protein [Sphingobium chlorophenolicum]
MARRPGCTFLPLTHFMFDAGGLLADLRAANVAVITKAVDYWEPPP